MRTWPALEVSFNDVPDLLQAALLDYSISAVDETAANSWRVFFNTEADRDAAVRDLPHQFPELTFEVLDIPDDDWAARSQATLGAVHIGRIIVAPPWDVPDVAGPQSRTRPTLDVSRPGPDLWTRPPITIVIQPSMGFGTGHHATTRLCLAALQQLDLRGRRVLDVGTGSGVLAIAASRLDAGDVRAIDDDPDAIQAARENLSLNPGVTVTLRTADLRSSDLGTHDVVVANLTGGLLIQAAGRLHDLTVPSARLILSGFLTHEESGVRAVYRDFALSARAHEDEWVCVTLERTS